jgi:hypothetical protein
VRRAFVVLLAVASFGLVAVAGNAPAATPTPLSSAVCGTWVLQQASSVTELRNLKSQIDAALNLPGVVGFSLRFPWKSVDTNFALLNEGLSYAQAHGKQFSIRFMAGRHTPARVFDAGSPFYLKGAEKVPAPFFANGSPNAVFEGAWDEFVGRLAVWSRANGVHLLHLAWYGQDWAELNNGIEVRGAAGYTQANWTNAHKRLVEFGARHSGPDLAVEVPLSGYGPLSNGPSALLADHIIAQVGAGSDQFFFQANGWGPNGDWGAPTASVEAEFDAIWLKSARGAEQMIQPQDYNWASVFRHLYTNDAAYAEVYLPSFGMASRAQLASEIAAFAASRCAPPATTTTLPPTTTTTVLPTTTTTLPPTTTTTTLSADTRAPSVPSGLRVASRTRTSVTVCWNASTDNVGVAGYFVSVDGNWVATVADGLCDRIDGLRRRTTYTVGVRAFDDARNASPRATLDVRTRA